MRYDEEKETWRSTVSAMKRSVYQVTRFGFNSELTKSTDLTLMVFAFPKVDAGYCVRMDKGKEVGPAVVLN